MTTDIKRSHVVMSVAGRWGPTETFSSDTWEWDGNSWTQREDSGPAAREYARAAWDPVGSGILLFGGRASGIAFSDTWTWGGDQWKQVADIGPTGRQGHAITSNGKRVLLFGGQAVFAARPQDRSLPTAGTPTGGFHTTLEKDTWAWDGHRWMQIQDIGPPARMNHAMTYDEKRDSIVLFGGEDQNTTRFGDTWEPRAGDIEQPTRPA
jgi:hypothetical protein